MNPKPTLHEPSHEPVTVSDCIRTHLDKFFSDLDGDSPQGMYDMVILAVERPLLEWVMNKAGHNQTLASQMLGITRNTLRKKLQIHGLLSGTP